MKVFDKRHNGVIVHLSDNKEAFVITQFRKSLCILFAFILVSSFVTSMAQGQTSETAQPPTSFEDDQQDYPEDQLSMNDESSIPAQPAPYSIDEDPAMRAEPIDDDGDF